MFSPRGGVAENEVEEVQARIVLRPKPDLPRARPTLGIENGPIRRPSLKEIGLERHTAIERVHPRVNILGIEDFLQAWRSIVSLHRLEDSAADETRNQTWHFVLDARPFEL